MSAIETTPEATAGSGTWFEKFYARVDALDLTVAEDLQTEDTSMTMGNHPPAVGREDVRAGMERFFGTIKGMHHVISKVIEDGDSATVEGICQYTRLDGSRVDIPVLTALERRGDRIAAQRVYIDLAPLFDPAAH